jgi:hypothetical protein
VNRSHNGLSSHIADRNILTSDLSIYLSIYLSIHLSATRTMTLRDSIA